MTRVTSILSLLLVLLLSNFALAQVKVVKKPAPKVGADEEVVYDTWTSSWGLRDDRPDSYPLGISTHKTEAEAVAAAKAHIARTAGNGALAVTHYLIEGEPSVHKKSVERVKEGLDLLSRLKEAKEAVEHAKKVEKGEASLLKAKERKLGDTIKEYKDRVAQSYKQAVEAKKTLTGGVVALTDAKMREVNGLISTYNRQVEDFSDVMGNTADLGYNALALVEAPESKKEESAVVGTWKGVSVLGEERLNVTTVFHKDGTLTMTFENGRSGRFSWRQEGNAILVGAPGGGTEKWNLNGNQISGSYKSSRGLPGSFSYTKQ